MIDIARAALMKRGNLDRLDAVKRLPGRGAEDGYGDTAIGLQGRGGRGGRAMRAVEANAKRGCQQHRGCGRAACRRFHDQLPSKGWVRTCLGVTALLFQSCLNK